MSTDFYQFPITDNDIENIKKITTLNEMLSGIVEFELKDMNKTSLLTIRIDSEKVKNKLNRNAGRKRRCTEKTYTLEEVKKMLKNLTAKEVAENLGLSRATLYRRLKDAEERSKSLNIPEDQTYIH